MPNDLRYQSPKSRREQDDPSFRPHQHYPNLNANAGADEAAPGSRIRRQARRPIKPPRARIRLDSKVPVPAMRLRGKPAAEQPKANLRSGGRWMSLVALIGILALIYWLFTSSTFHVSKVEVKGSNLLKEAEVLRLTGADKDNIFLLNEDDVASRLRLLPYVLDVKVSKSIPDRLVVEVSERSPAINWKVGNVGYLVDREGVVLSEVVEKDLSEQARTFTVIESLDDRRLKLGDRVDTVAVRSAPLIQGQLAQAGIKIAALQYSPSNGLLAISAPEAGKWKALIGTDAQLDRKINILKGLMADKNIKWSYADLRFVDSPASQ
jgi:cell division septal protein FtsQ